MDERELAYLRYLATASSPNRNAFMAGHAAHMVHISEQHDRIPLPDQPLTMHSNREIAPRLQDDLVMRDEALDERIAREIYDWFLDEDSQGVSCWYAHTLQGGETIKVHADTTLTFHLWGPSVRYMSGLPYFSSDMSAAWAVMETIRDRGLGVFVLPHEQGWEVEVAVDELHYHAGYRCSFSAHASAAQAICLAALGAMSNVRIHAPALLPTPGLLPIDGDLPPPDGRPDA